MSGPTSSPCLRLSLGLDPERLRADLARVSSELAEPPFAPPGRRGWRELVLRAPGGDPRLYPGSIDPAVYAATPTLARCPYLREVLDGLACPVLSVRIAWVAPSSHARDDERGSVVALRVVIASSDDVVASAGPGRVRARPADVLCVGPQPFHVETDATSPYTELLVDCIPNDWLRAQLATGVDVREPAGAPDARALPMTSVESLFAALLGDADAVARLSACESDEAIALVAHDLAPRVGGSAARVALESALRGTRGLALTMSEVPAGDGWLPAEARWRDGELEVSWCWLGERVEPGAFHDDLVRAARRRAMNRALRPTTSLAVLERSLAGRPGPPVIGLVAHVSRCGSTLAARMLGCIANVAVASEAAPLDVALRDGDVPDALRVRALRALAAALGRAQAGCRGLVVKLDAWHLTAMPMLREAFPDVPCVLLYRDPTEVLASQMREPGLSMVRHAIGAAFDAAAPSGLDVLETRARIVGLLFDAAARLAPSASTVSYEELPDAVTMRIAPGFGLVLGASELEAMQAIAMRDSKRLALPFVAAPSDDAPATTAVRESAERWAGPAYRTLVERRARENTR